MARKSADNGHQGRASIRRSDRLLSSVKEASTVTFVSHVNPDPDSLGSMLGLSHLVHTCLKKPTRLIQDGVISRAENRAMVELLKIDLVPLEGWRQQEGEAVIMVDSQPCTGRHSFPEDTRLAAVVDHHDTPGDVSSVPFVDVRPGLGATCTIVTNYLTEQNVSFPRRVATALLYGIETELTGYPREGTATDDSAHHFLYPLADKDLLARIRNAPVPQDTFGCFLQALQRSFIYDRLIISWVNDLSAPELPAEVADFLIRFDAVDWAFCAGVYQQQLVMSLRAAVEGGNAGCILRDVAGQLGGCGGGHDRRAGGAIPLPNNSPTKIEQLQSDVRRGLIKALQIEECRGHRLVSPREMMNYLRG